MGTDQHQENCQDYDKVKVHERNVVSDSSLTLVVEPSDHLRYHHEAEGDQSQDDGEDSIAGCVCGSRYEAKINRYLA